MTIERALTGLTKAGASAAVYSEDVFSTYLYTGTGASQTITNGIDLSTKGGLVWTKARSTTTNNFLFDTSNGTGKFFYSNLTSPEQTDANTLSAYNTTGFTLGNDSGYYGVNVSGQTYCSWTFRKAVKFFDVVTYTGTGSANTISHALGATPGMIIVKRTDATGAPKVYHNGLTSAAYYCNLNATTAQTSDSTVWNSTAPTSSVFSVGTHADVNASGGTYVAYIYAASNSGGFGSAGTDSVVACGSFTGDSTITLGWEPQYLLFKRTDSTSNWRVLDNMRGLPVIADSTGSQQVLLANTSGAESIDGIAAPTATGFKTFLGAGTYIYLAIRRGPMKTPTDATKVFAPITSSAATGTKLTTGFPIDLQIPIARTYNGVAHYVTDRLRGFSSTTTESGYAVDTSNTGAESSVSTSRLWDNTGFQIPSSWATLSSIYWNFARAPGFFDVVCYSGNSASRMVNHNLGVVPELIIVKDRTSSTPNWCVYYNGGSTFNTIHLNLTGAAYTSGLWDTTPTTTQFSVSNNASVNSSSDNYVAYLFATCAGVSKVGSYTGTGSAQNINCGFASGARFVLIKTTNTVGNWWVFDTARGINSSANDPVLYLNASAAEVTYLDFISPYSGGFALTSGSAANNSGDSYIYLAIA